MININEYFLFDTFILNIKKSITAINMPPIDVKMMQIMLLSAVVILGVYILIINSIAYVQENSIADYHIGCFLYDEAHHQSNHFKHRLLKLKKNA